MTTSHDGYDYADEEALLRALDASQEALRAAGIPFLVMGGIASAIMGRPRWTRDIDLFVRLEDAAPALERLEAAGFETWVEYPHWLAKARHGGIVVDVISRSQGDILLDEEMVERAVEATFRGREVRVVPPEDLVVMKAVAASEDTPRYWYDAIGIIGRTDLDWEYLVRRARPAGARRVLAVLLYAQSIDVIVPTNAIRTLIEMVLGPGPSTVPVSAEGDAGRVDDPGGYHTEMLRKALATDPRILEPELQVVPDGDALVITGLVPTEERHRAIDEVADELADSLDGRRVVNLTEVASFSSPAPQERIP